jgi:DNA replication protein DnaC
VSYPKEIFGAAMEELARRRDEARRTAARRREEIARTLPEADRLQRQLGATSAKLAQAVLGGGEGIETIRLTSERAYKLLKIQLQKAGFPEDYTQTHYNCPVCSDTGFVEGGYCACLRKLLSQLMIKRLGIEQSLLNCSFDNFSLDYYPAQADGDGPSPRSLMNANLARCRQWADDFSLSAPSLLFVGATGLGKTHLSMAIARRVIELGYDVLYYPFGSLLTELEARRFGRDGDYAEGLTPLLSCELLILDDLGAEFTSPFGQSLLYELINSRMVTARPSLISTNLTLGELESRYGDRIFSRLIGGYETLLFRGRDVRLIKRYGPET